MKSSGAARLAVRTAIFVVCRAVAFLTAVAGFGIALFFVAPTLLGFDVGLARSYRKGEVIEREFRQARSFITGFRSTHHRNPTPDEFEHAYRPHRYRVTMETESFSTGATDLFGVPPKNSYFLGIWRGEWMEYYSPWEDQSSVPNNYIFGSPWLEQLSIAVVSLGLLAGSAFLWRAPRSRPN